MDSKNEISAGRVRPERPSADREHENRAAGDGVMELDLDVEHDPSPQERSDGSDAISLDP